jgi:ribonuclease R
MVNLLPVSRQFIHEFMTRPGYRPLTLSEMARTLSLDSGSKRALRSLLKDLRAEGVVECLRKNQWAPASAPQRERTGRVLIRPDGVCRVRPDSPGTGEEADVRISDEYRLGALPDDRVVMVPDPDSRGRMPRGRIVRILERTRESLVGLLQFGTGFPRLIPDESGIPMVRVTGIEPERAVHLENHKGVVRLAKWSPDDTGLRGELEEVLGLADAPGVDMLCLMRRREYRQDFPPAVRRAAKRAARNPSEADLQGRLDLRGQFTLTVDPETARDFDDAVSVEQGPDGSWQLGVHIADVGHFVNPGDAVDREALSRGNSVYLVDRAILMLPQELTAETCSLVPDADRLTRSVLLRLDATGQVKHAEMHRAVIHSRARLTYPQAQAVLEGKEVGLPSPVVDTVRKLGSLTRLLRERRMAEESLEFQVPELDCRLDETGRIVSFRRRDGSPAYQLIEECMLLANVAVARRLLAHAPAGLFRIHDEPDAEQWTRMAAELDAMGVNLSARNRNCINRISRRASRSPLQYSLTMAILRNLKRATYCPDARPHFGLAFDAYTHFTSPIRRYPDLIVHRLLDAAERGLPPPYSAEELGQIAGHCSATERAADAASAESIEVKRLQYYAEAFRAGRNGPHPAVVTGVTARGLLVELPDTLLRGLVPFPSLPGDHYVLSENRTRAKGLRTRHAWTLGDRISVELTRVDTVRRMVDFRPAGVKPRRKGR